MLWFVLRISSLHVEAGSTPSKPLYSLDNPHKDTGSCVSVEKSFRVVNSIVQDTSPTAIGAAPAVITHSAFQHLRRKLWSRVRAAGRAACSRWRCMEMGAVRNPELWMFFSSTLWGRDGLSISLLLCSWLSTKQGRERRRGHRERGYLKNSISESAQAKAWFST